MSPTLTSLRPCTSAELVQAIAGTDFRSCAVTIVGMGGMGAQFVQAARALGVRRLRLVSRSATQLAPFQGQDGITCISSGIERFAEAPQPDELAVVATPIALLAPAAERLASLGFRHLLIEKPVALGAAAIEQLAARFEAQGVEAACAYNRAAYPSVVEARVRIEQEGGATSCAYAFTEMIKPDWPQRFSAEELARWGIANSLHVMSVAHALIGVPAAWSGQRAGSLPWHPTGAVFVGSGVSERRIPFSYHADWGSTGRWSVEAHTRASSYRFCPLETLSRRVSAVGEWSDVPVEAFAPQVKTGIVEELAAMLSPEIRARVPLPSLRSTAALTRYGESVFGYDAAEGA